MSEEESSKYIYVTYMSNDRDYKGVLLLNYNLKKYNHKYNLACIILEGVSNNVRNILKKSNIHVHEYCLKEILSQFNIKDDYSDYLLNKHYYGKYIIFNLLNYKKIIYLDSDLLIRENIDHLFNYDTTNKIYITYDVFFRSQNKSIIFKKNQFNSGVIILEPSNKIYNILYEKISDFIGKKDELITDQTIFNLLNEQSYIIINYLDFKYNFISVLGNNEYIIKNENPAIVHFILHPKPWNIIDLDENILQLKIYSNPKKYFLEWIDLYFDMVKKILNNMTECNIFLDFKDVFLVENSYNNEIGVKIENL